MLRDDFSSRAHIDMILVRTHLCNTLPQREGSFTLKCRQNVFKSQIILIFDHLNSYEFKTIPNVPNDYF